MLIGIDQCEQGKARDMAANKGEALQSLSGHL
ncbi:hypothetical protein WG8_1290 [Paenibacillus sp. Aloe-11]|nr:hypothetical protein WG8_1290 [Paenibacillus sp. Aloe-11]